MINSIKIEIISNKQKEIFEKGKDGIKSIGIDEENQIIKVFYDNSSEWDSLTIPFSKMDSFNSKSF